MFTHQRSTFSRNCKAHDVQTIDRSNPLIVFIYCDLPRFAHRRKRVEQNLIQSNYIFAVMSTYNSIDFQRECFQNSSIWSNAPCAVPFFAEMNLSKSRVGSINLTGKQGSNQFLYEALQEDCGYCLIGTYSSSIRLVTLFWAIFSHTMFCVLVMNSERD